MRTNIKYSSIDKQLKVIIVTSADANEGKTSTSSNLAITLAQAGNKVLLIDADLRKPKVHKYFRLNNDHGLTNILMTYNDRDNAINLHKFMRIPNLFVITSGVLPPNFEMIETNKMSKLVEYLRSEYDIIIIDTLQTMLLMLL